MTRTFHFVSAVDHVLGVPIAIALCLEHDIATQTTSVSEIRSEGALVLRARMAACRDVGIDPWLLQPPPEHAVKAISILPGSLTFEITIEVA